VGVKLSVSLSSADVEFLDSYSHQHGFGSRSATVQEAIRVLRASELGDAYEEAWTEWETAGEAEAWEAATADGLAQS
jgi:Arc/MetJ-type ribon-helix-helix transcriptional regulator